VATGDTTSFWLSCAMNDYSLVWGNAIIAGSYYVLTTQLFLFAKNFQVWNERVIVAQDRII
jgi:hypothetical protein